MSLAVILSGGGIKSAVAAARYAGERQLVFVHVNFGQRCAAEERRAVTQTAERFESSRVIGLDLPHVLQLQEAKAAEGPSATTARSTGIVGTRALSAAALRGLLPTFLSVGTQCALRCGADRLVVGLSRWTEAAHLGLPLAEAQPDRLRELLHAYNILLDVQTGKRGGIVLEAPLIDLTFEQMVRLAAHLQIPLEGTRSCERTGPRPCTRCDQCRARAEAFFGARLPDPAIAPAPAAV